MATKSGSTEQYSEVVQRLQALVEQLEGGGLSLEDSLEKFAEGIQLVRKGEKLLSEAEKRIEQLLSDDAGNKVVPLELKEGGEPAGAAQAQQQQQKKPAAPQRRGGTEEDDVPFDLDAWLKVEQARVEQLLAARMAEISARAPKRLAEAMSYSLLAGGKRLRPVLCLAFADAVSRSSTLSANAAACAVEMVHTYSLIHDDLPAMDDDDLRRGRPTNHKVYGEAMAILAGDALLTDAFASLSGALAGELAYAAGSSGMVGGQVLDIAEDRPAEEAYLLKLHRAKTGALIKCACRMGVIASGGTDAQLAAAETYGDAVGLGFQIADDILDVTASAKDMGKPTGADAAAGRHTFPAVVGLERARALAQEQVQRAISAVAAIDGDDGPLAALARYSVERKN